MPNINKANTCSIWVDSRYLSHGHNFWRTKILSVFLWAFKNLMLRRLRIAYPIGKSKKNCGPRPTISKRTTSTLCTDKSPQKGPQCTLYQHGQTDDGRRTDGRTYSWEVHYGTFFRPKIMGFFVCITGHCGIPVQLVRIVEMNMDIQTRVTLWYFWRHCGLFEVHKHCGSFEVHKHCGNFAVHKHWGHFAVHKHCGHFAVNELFVS